MGLRGPHAYPWSARFPPAPKVHVTHTANLLHMSQTIHRKENRRDLLQ